MSKQSWHIKATKLTPSKTGREKSTECLPCNNSNAIKQTTSVCETSAWSQRGQTLPRGICLSLVFKVLLWSWWAQHECHRTHVSGHALVDIPRRQERRSDIVTSLTPVFTARVQGVGRDSQEGSVSDVLVGSRWLTIARGHLMNSWLRTGDWCQPLLARPKINISQIRGHVAHKSHSFADMSKTTDFTILSHEMQ